MTPCEDCTTQPPRAATHTVYFIARQQRWKSYPVPPPEPRARLCRWHATVRAVQLNADRQRQDADPARARAVRCADCSLLQPRVATHGLKFDGHSASWVIAQRPKIGRDRILYCKWHASVRAVQRNARGQRPPRRAPRTAAQGA
jgi:hypothetical protein